MTEEKMVYDVGCYGDGSFGPDHTMIKCIEIAMDNGYDPVDDIDLFDKLVSYHNAPPLSRDDLTFEEREILNAIEDDAIDYLNDECSDDSHWWGYQNGDFGYWGCE